MGTLTDAYAKATGKNDSKGGDCFGREFGNPDCIDFTMKTTFGTIFGMMPF